MEKNLTLRYVYFKHEDGKLSVIGCSEALSIPFMAQQADVVVKETLERGFVIEKNLQTPIPITTVQDVWELYVCGMFHRSRTRPWSS